MDSTFLKHMNSQCLCRGKGKGAALGLASASDSMDLASDKALLPSALQEAADPSLASPAKKPRGRRPKATLAAADEAAAAAAGGVKEAKVRGWTYSQPEEHLLAERLGEPPQFSATVPHSPSYTPVNVQSADQAP